jgi:hypothetical protein
MSVDLCTWCIGVLAWDTQHLRIQGEDRLPGSVHAQLPMVLKALEEGRSVRFGVSHAELTPAVTTWHSDPICTMHLVRELGLGKRPAPGTYY